MPLSIAVCVKRTPASTSVAVDAASNTYTADPSAGRVVVRDAWGRLVSVKNGLLTPTAVAVDGFGRILVAEQGAGSVSVFDRGWRLLAKLGQGNGEFQLPNDIAVDPASGAIYVSDGAANLVKAYTADWAPLFSFGGTGRALGQFSFPAALHMSASGELFVADQNNDRVQVFARDGKPLRCFGGRTGGMRMAIVADSAAAAVRAGAACSGADVADATHRVPRTRQHFDQLIHVLRGVQRRQGDAQARLALGHGRRTDRGHPEARAFQRRGQRQRCGLRAGSPPLRRQRCAYGRARVRLRPARSAVGALRAPATPSRA